MPRPANRTATEAATAAHSSAPPSRLVSRSALATMLGVTPARVSQMVTGGVLPSPDEHGRHDALDAVLALLDYLRRDQPMREARAAAIRSSAAANETRVRRQLRQLITLDEFGELLGIITERLVELAQSESGALYHELAPVIGPERATAAASRSHARLRGVALAVRHGTGALIDDLRAEVLPDPERVSAAYAELIAVRLGQPDDVADE